MRILMIAQSNFDYDARIIRFASALNEKNITVDAICLANSNQPSFEVINGGNIFRVKKSFNKNSIITYIFHSISFLFLTIVKTLLISSKFKYDAIHVHNMPDYLVFSTFVFKLKKIPILLDFHDLTVELFKDKWANSKNKFFIAVLEFVEKISCNFADHIITVTHECIAKLDSRGIRKSNISLIMNSADENVFSYSTERFNKNGSFLFLYHGTIAKRFGLHFFISAFTDILRYYPNVQFHIYGIGDEDYINLIQKMIFENNLQNNVSIKSFVPYSEVNDLISKYDIGVVTYEQGGYMDVVFPTKVGEYAVNGLPLVVSTLPAIKTIFSEDSVCYVDPLKTEEVSQRVIELISDKHRRIHMSRKAHDLYKSYSWDEMKIRYLAIIESLKDNKKSI